RLGGDQVALAAALLQRQPLFREPVPHHEVPARVPPPVRHLPGRPCLLWPVLWLVQRRAPPLRHRVPHPRRRPLRPRRAGAGPAGRGAQPRLRRPPRALRRQATPTTGAARGGLDQPAEGRHHYDTVIPEGICLTKVDTPHSPPRWSPSTWATAARRHGRRRLSTVGCCW